MNRGLDSRDYWKMIRRPDSLGGGVNVGSIVAPHLAARLGPPEDAIGPRRNSLLSRGVVDVRSAAVQLVCRRKFQVSLRPAREDSPGGFFNGELVVCQHHVHHPILQEHVHRSPVPLDTIVEVAHEHAHVKSIRGSPRSALE